jgi:hypothetical protein
VTPCGKVGDADHSGVVAKGGQDEPGLWPVAAARQMATERGDRGIDQQPPSLGHSPAQDDQRGIEDGCH